MAAARTGTEALWKQCYEILPEVSRTFALAILGLREPLKGDVCVSYLICRILDTVEDAPGLTTRERAEMIDPFLEAMAAGKQPAKRWHSMTLRGLGERSANADLRLMEEIPIVLRCLYACPDTDILTIVRWATEMGRGMVECSESMGPDGELKTLPHMRALDRYCYFIAGTVGYMLTDLFYLQSPHIDETLYFRLQSDAEAFGLGLQKVNIVKDFAKDLPRGWCFIPRDALGANGLAPADLTDSKRARDIRLAVLPVMRTAAGHLARAWRYLEAMPIEEREVRLFLSYSLFFALATLGLAVRKPALLAGKKKLKISRTRVASIMATCQRHVSKPDAFRKAHGRLVAPLERLAEDDPF